ncbi:hypothetical protein JKY79_03305 [Candidatus Babeliales bacterium]|nr:hypothetical protein [Candidatus Babeliales bacterium]
MNIALGFWGIIGTIFSCIVLSYVSIATMFGPFIAPVLVLFASILFRGDVGRGDKKLFEHKLAIFQAIGSVGGMIAIGVGFTFPTLYFLSPTDFHALLQNKWYFSGLLGITTLIAGLFGLWLGRLYSRALLERSGLRFPVSVMIHETIVAQDHKADAKLLVQGTSFSLITCLLRDGLKAGSLAIPSVFSWFGLSKNIIIAESIFGNALALSIMPMVWAIGFTAGMTIVVPLLVGALSKYLVVYPLNMHSLWLPWTFFKPLSQGSFLTAFCSGLVLAELFNGLSRYPGQLKRWIEKKAAEDFSIGNQINESVQMVRSFFSGHADEAVDQVSHWYDRYEGLLLFTLSWSLLYALGFSVFAALFTVVGAMFVTYNICFIAGKIGLVTFGRFVTFIMLPALFLFALTPFQITWLSIFVVVTMAAAANYLFSVKIGDLQKISRHDMHRYTMMGIFVTAAVIGLILWILCTNFELGSADLFGQRGRSRALLINSFSFDWQILLLGFMYGYFLRFLRLSPTMVFGGLLMPNNLTIGLLIGATINRFFFNNKTQHPFWSGMLAGDTLWEFFSIACKMFG